MGRLEGGQAVLFVLSSDGKRLYNHPMTASDRKLRVFLSYAKEDFESVHEIYERLQAEGWIDPWQDKPKLLPGEHWTAAIKKAIDLADAVVIFLSENAINKEGFIHVEMNYAWDRSLHKPLGTIYRIPIRLDECEPEDLYDLDSRQWVDYFGEKKDDTYQKLLASLKQRFEQIERLDAREQDRREREKIKAEEKARLESEEKVRKELKNQEQHENNSETRSPQLEKIRKILRDHHGILLTSDLSKFNIPRTYLSIMEQNGEIRRVTRGVYKAPSSFEDEMYIFQASHKSIVYSHETALYLHNLTDHPPLFYSITVPSGYHSNTLNDSEHKIFYVKRSLFQLGVIRMNTPHGNSISITGLERTICDVVRSRNQLDAQFFNTALKRYVLKKEKNLNLLYAYAKSFSVQNRIRQYLEILL